MSTSVEPARASVDGGPPPGGGAALSRSRFRSTRESEARILLLIDEFSRTARGLPRLLEGRVKLAKLDFLLRYPRHLRRVLEHRDVPEKDLLSLDIDDAPLDSRMMRYRYGPWDPAYYSVLGSLIGRGLVEISSLPKGKGLGYRTTEAGAGVALTLRKDESFFEVSNRLKLLKRHLDKTGSTLKAYLYELPEVSDANWFEEIS